MQNAIFTLSRGNFESHRSQDEKEQLGQIGLYYQPRAISKEELNLNVDDIVDSLDYCNEPQQNARYSFWEHQKNNL